MNETITSFTEELTLRENVIGIILFGSRARGDNRSDSDADLIVIVKEGYQRVVENRNEQTFEIVYVTKEDALDFWVKYPNDAAELWNVAKILYDKDGTVKELQKKAEEILKEGKKPINELQLGQYRFDAEDQIKVSALLADKDSVKANFILTNKVFALTGLFFDIKQLWTPAPKQRLEKIKEIHPELYVALKEFYADGALLKDKLAIAEKIVALVFPLITNNYQLFL
jgi:predicted nucleotidyltransferase